MKSFAMIALLVAAAVAAVFLVGRGQSEGTRTPADESGPHVLIVGVDGLDWGRFERLTSDGRLPNLSSLADSGAAGVLRSIPPYVSPTIWTCIATGKLGEKHGIGGFTVYGQTGSDDAKLINSEMIKCRTLWEILAGSGVSCGVIGWLVTYPPVPVTDYTISSNGVVALSSLPNRRPMIKAPPDLRVTVHPQELWDEIEPLGVMPADIPKDDLFAYLGDATGLEQGLIEDRTGFLSERLAVDRTTVAIAEKLMEERPTTVTAVYMRSCDQISHLFWRYWEPESWRRGEIQPEAVEAYSTVIDRYYENVDKMVGQILEHRGPNTIVIVCSDHGFAGHRGHAGFVPRSDTDVAFGKWMHRDQGVIVINGPGVSRGERIEGATVLDVTPTVLSVLDLPVGRDMDGRPLVSAFEQSFISRHPVGYTDTYDAGERAISDAPTESPVDEKEKEILRSLGYIE